MTIRIERYTEGKQAAWDAFVQYSKNGTFLFQRGYMDYHRHRFVDHSLIAYEADRVIALLPANVSGTSMISHEGLSYGGFISDKRMKLPLMLRLFDAALTYYREQGLTELCYKTIPHIYHRVPAQEDLYALYLCGAQVVERRAMTVAGHERVTLQERRLRGIRKAGRAGLRVCISEDFETYWHLLETALLGRHNARPVHTLDEMARLYEQFPRNIRLYACFEGEAMVAGVVIFESDFVARAQYIATGERGRDLNAVDLLFDHLLHSAFVNKPYFDFGTSHDPRTRALNDGLIDQKEGFGGRTVTQDTYRIDLTNWNQQALQEALT